MARDAGGSRAFIRLRAERRRCPAVADAGSASPHPVPLSSCAATNRSRSPWSIAWARAPLFTGTAWSSTASTTVCTGGAAATSVWPRSSNRIASFVVRFTPPRTGTFMYHTHLHDERQLPLGLYGPMIVIDSEETFDPATDHVLMVGRSGLDPASPNVLIPATPVVLNGEPAPRFVWKAGERHRVRLINITPDDIFTVSLQTSQGPVAWTPVTKDGAPMPPSARIPTACTADDCRRRDLRLRARHGARPAEPVDRSAQHRRKVAGAGSGDRQVRTSGRAWRVLAGTGSARASRRPGERRGAESAWPAAGLRQRLRGQPSATASKAAAPGLVTANRCQGSPPDTSGCAPRSRNATPDPATRSVTVRDTSTSPRAASSQTARARSNAAPPRDPHG